MASRKVCPLVISFLKFLIFEIFFFIQYENKMFFFERSMATSQIQVITLCVIDVILVIEVKLKASRETKGPFVMKRMCE